MARRQILKEDIGNPMEDFEDTTPAKPIDEPVQPGSSKQVPEVFLEITKQKQVNEELRQQLQSMRDIFDRTRDTSRSKGKTSWCGQQITLKRTLVVIGSLTLFTLVILLIFISYQWHLTDTTSKEISELNQPQSIVQGLPVKGDANGNGDPSLKYYFNLVMSQDSKLEECQGPEIKHSFPDVDYALLGYNILKGYPLAVGHDPGFTYPIFSVDYRDGKQSADCRFSIPNGLVIIPDVSCVTSFESRSVTTKYEFFKSLSVAASVEGSGWGVSFSASVNYKETSSVIASGEYIYILSSAKCNYYFSKLIETKPPTFDDAFLVWVYKLDRTNAVETYIAFFELFGTHFPVEVTFGSRFTYEFRMKSSAYESEQERDVNVASRASFYGWWIASGSASLNVDNSQREKAEYFSKLVTTRTITVGAAPPNDGDALTWASTVKESPVPTSYTLASIEELFTEKFMNGINANYKNIYKNIVKYKYEYCKYLRDIGDLDSCEVLTPGIILETTQLERHYGSVAATFAECIEHCLEELHCEAISFCKGCRRGQNAHNTCFMFRNTSTPLSAVSSPDWESIAFDSKIRDQLKISDVAIVGIERGFENQTDTGSTLLECYDLCKQDAYCVAYTYCECPTKVNKCHLYSDRSINKLTKETGTDAFFLSSRH